MAEIHLETLSMGKGTYRLVGHQEEDGGHALRIRLEHTGDARCVDITFSQTEMGMIFEWAKELPAHA